MLAIDVVDICLYLQGNSARSLTSYATAIQSTTMATSGNLEWTADKVLDGCLTKKCIARTQTEKDNWLRIDLGNVYKISSIIIYTASSHTCMYK